MDITTAKGTYSAAELKEPITGKAFDILAVMIEEPNEDGTPTYRMIDYVWGISLMTDREIHSEVIRMIQEYESKAL